MPPPPPFFFNTCLVKTCIWELHIFHIYCSITLSNLQVPASFMHPLRGPSKPPVKLPLIMTAQQISLRAQSHVKVYLSLIASKNQLASLRVADWKCREWLASLENSKILKRWLKNSFRQLLSKMLFRFSYNLKYSRNSQKNENTAFCLLKYAKKYLENWRSSRYSHWNNLQN